MAGYYGYHQTIKQRIKKGELTGFEYVDSYKGIEPCLLLFFSCGVKVKPVREHRWPEYESILFGGAITQNK